MKVSRWLKLLAIHVGLGVGVSAGQQAGSPTDAGTATARVYEVGPDVVAPQLLPKEWKIPDAEACTRESDDEISLSVIVDTNGKPHDVTLINPVGTALERLAMRIVEADTFEPGTLNGTAVQVKVPVHVSIEGCYATKKDANGNSTEVFRLRAQPKQTLGEKRRQEYIAPEPPEEPDAAAQPEGLKRLDPETAGLEHVGKNGVSAPVPLNSVEAEFSDEARRANIEGVCLVSAIVDTHGNPVNLRIARAIGHGLDEKALEAVRKYHFKPAMKAGVPVPVMITIEVNFRL